MTRWILFLGLGICMPAIADGQRPNVLLIMADDLGYGDVGCYGCRDIRTPNIDKLALQGVRFTNFYANAPECSPTRTALLTGRYQQRVGGLECAIGLGNVGRYDDAIRLRADNQLGLPPEESLVIKALKKAGYATGIVGKWHLGYEPHFLPLKHGFDYAFGPLGGAVDYFYHNEPSGYRTLYLNDKPIQREGYLTDLITSEAVKFIATHGNKPFFLYVPFTAPHTPYQGPDHQPEVPVSLEELNKGSRDTFIKMVERLDDGIGAILQILREKGVTKNTLVIFTSDNGANRIGRNTPFSGHKSSLFEGGIRVPCVMRWPGVLAGGEVVDHVAITMDLSASIVRLAGAQSLGDRLFDGIDIIQALREKSPPKKRTLFWRARRGERTWRAVLDGPIKYISRRDGKLIREYLFDLVQDPGEKSNLLTERPEEVERFKQLLAHWEAEVRSQR
ncbi:MAG: sulfatase-like hydrolase/transferase [Planctomycetota bacterium]|nr:MAG: sulfatase-like hydrolase/transferase [Planctomycetota bacterium]